jgi:hypothetical protein
MAVSFLTKAVDLTVGRIHSREQSRRAVAFVIMRQGLAATALERQSGLRTVQRLNLAFLVYAQHQSVFGRVQIQSQDVLQFLFMTHYTSKRVHRDVDSTRDGVD